MTQSGLATTALKPLLIWIEISLQITVPGTENQLSLDRLALPCIRSDRRLLRSSRSKSFLLPTDTACVSPLTAERTRATCFFDAFGADSARRLSLSLSLSLSDQTPSASWTLLRAHARVDLYDGT